MADPVTGILEQQRSHHLAQISQLATFALDRSPPPLAVVANPTAIAISPRIQATVPISA